LRTTTRREHQTRVARAQLAHHADNASPTAALSTALTVDDKTVRRPADATAPQAGISRVGPRHAARRDGNLLG
jgi:hypothetical protein